MPSAFRKGKVYPLVSLFKCRISIFQERKAIQVKVPDFKEKYPKKSETNKIDHDAPRADPTFNDQRMMFSKVPTVAGAIQPAVKTEPEPPKQEVA